jgi:predicted transcriptional regulator
MLYFVHIYKKFVLQAEITIYFDKTISMEQQAKCDHKIRNIGRIQSLISVDACRTLVCSLVISRLAYVQTSF